MSENPLAYYRRLGTQEAARIVAAFDPDVLDAALAMAGRPRPTACPRCAQTEQFVATHGDEETRSLVLALLDD
jgi:hypothetical protein